MKNLLNFTGSDLTSSKVKPVQSELLMLISVEKRYYSRNGKPISSAISSEFRHTSISDKVDNDLLSFLCPNRSAYEFRTNDDTLTSDDDSYYYSDVFNNPAPTSYDHRNYSPRMTVGPITPRTTPHPPKKITVALEAATPNLKSFNFNILRKEFTYTKLKYSRSPAFDIVSGGSAALFAAFLGFLISEKFGIELVDSGDFYYLLMYMVIFSYTLKSFKDTLCKTQSFGEFITLKYLSSYGVSLVYIFMRTLRFLNFIRFFGVVSQRIKKF